MDTYLSEVVRYLTAQSWQIAVLTIAVAAVTFALRHRSAHVRYLLWLIVVAKCLVPPLHAVPLRVLPQAVPELVPSLLSPPAWNSERSIVSDRVPLGSPSPQRAESAPSPTVLPPRAHRLSGSEWLGVLWIAGAAAAMTLNLLRALRGHHWLRKSRQPLPAEVEVAAVEMLRACGVRKMPSIWMVEGVGQPFVWGLVRGSIYVPLGFLGIESPEHRRNVLAHELSHIVRFDAAVNFLQVIAQAIFWFHPFLWWANRRIRVEREKCCDETAIARLGTPAKDYCSAVVETLAKMKKSTRPVPSLAVAGPVKNIEERIRAMLRPGKEFYKHPSFPVAALVVLLFVLAVPTTLVLTVRAENLPPTDGAGADRVFANPTNLGPSVDSSSDEYNPSISADELELYFTSLRAGGQGPDLWVTTRKTKTDPWGEAVNLGPTVNSPAGDKTPCISVDGLSLYFGSDRPGGYGAHDLWVTTRKSKGAPWGEPVNLGPTVNSPADELSPSVSTDGLELYFSGHPASPELARPGGSGESDLWVTKRKTIADPWGTPVNLGPTVNSPLADGSPSISGDGLSLYLNSDRPGGYSTGDVRAIWVTTRKSTSEPWGVPVPLGPAVNAYWENNPNISRDGSTLYFSSRRPGGVGGADIWQATLGKSTPQSKAAQLAAALLGAAKAGDMERVRSLLSQGAGINATDTQGQAPLHQAAANHRRDVVQLLLEKSANVEAADASGQTPLHRASTSGGKYVTALLLAKGANINARDNRGNTPLHAAARSPESGGRDFLEFLLAKGADVNARNEQGQTPLHLVPMTRRQDKDLASAAGALLAHGAEVDATDKTGCTPLHVATQSGQAKVVGVLLAKGAAVDKKTKDGLLALHSAVTAGYKEIVALLLAKGANVNVSQPNGQTPLHVAAQAGYNEIAELLIAKGAEVNAKNARGETPAQVALAQDPPGTVRLLLARGAAVSTIQLAAYAGDLAKVKDYIEKGLSVNAEDPYGLRALHAAAAARQKEVAEYLIAAGASVNAASAADGLGTPLHYAAHTGCPYVTDLLVLKGAAVDAGNSKGETPLHLAAQMGHTASCRRLISSKANVNLRARNEWTPLHYAAASGQKEAATLLIEKGADINATARGRTPLEIAAGEKHREVVKLLVDKGADVSASSTDLLYYAAYHGYKELAEACIKKGANVNSKAWGDAVALWVFYDESDDSWGDVLELLLAHGADPDATDSSGWSLLHYAVYEETSIVRNLLDKGANPNVIDGGGRSPLHYAVQEGQRPAVELLIAHGADANVKDYDGRTPLSWAKEKGHNEIVEFLQQHGAKE